MKRAICGILLVCFASIVIVKGANDSVVEKVMAFTEACRNRETLDSAVFTPLMHSILWENNVAIELVVMNYLSPEDGNLIFEKLSVENKRKIVEYLSVPIVLDNKAVVDLEHDLMNKIKYLMFGEPVLSGIMEKVETGEREELLGVISAKNKDLAGRLSASILVISNILELDPVYLPVLVRASGIALFVQMLLTLDSGPRAQALGLLPEQLQEKIGEELSFQKPWPAQKLNQEKTRFIGIMRRLLDEGRINYK